MGEFKDLTEKKYMSDSDEYHVIDNNNKDKKISHTNLRSSLLDNSSFDVRHNSYSTGDIGIKFKTVSGVVVDRNPYNDYAAISHGIVDISKVVGILFIQNKNTTSGSYGYYRFFIDDDYIYAFPVFSSVSDTVTVCIFYED